MCIVQYFQREMCRKICNTLLNGIFVFRIFVLFSSTDHNILIKETFTWEAKKKKLIEAEIN